MLERSSFYELILKRVSVRGKPKKRCIDRIESDTKIAVVSKEEVGWGGVDPNRCVGQGGPTPYSWEWRSKY